VRVCLCFRVCLFEDASVFVCSCVCVCVCLCVCVCVDSEVNVCIARFVGYGKTRLKKDS
jgi:hypothetical protein